MKKFKKVFNLKIIYIFLVIFFFLNSVAYSSDPAARPHLRSNILSNTEKGIERLKNGMDFMSNLRGSLIKKVSWSDVVPVSVKNRGVYSITQKVQYGGENYLAKWAVRKDLDEKIIVPEAAILKYLESQGVKGIPKIEHVLEMEDGQKVILFKKFNTGQILDKKKGKLSRGEAIDIMLTVSGIVKSLSESGVYHWDIKPENIWITNKGEITLFDFGLAFMNKDEFMKRELYKCRSFLYMSPNRVSMAKGLKEGATFSYSDEIYSLGMSLAELLGLRLHYDDNEIISEAINNMDGKTLLNIIFSRLAESKGAISKEAEVILKKAFNAQYNNIDEFIKDLEMVRIKDLSVDKSFDRRLNYYFQSNGLCASL